MMSSILFKCFIVRSCFWSVIIFGLTSYFGLLRITVDMELRGVDYLKHGESAYPAEVQGDSINIKLFQEIFSL